MYECLLYGQIPASRHDQLLNILAGLSAMQPQRVLERRVLFKPSTIPEVTGPARGGTQGVAAQKTGQQNPSGGRTANTDVFYVNVVKAVEEQDLGKSGDGGDEASGWRWRFQETPVPGRKLTLLRQASEFPVKTGSLDEYMGNFGYEYVQETLLDGHQFILDNTILLLHRIYTYPPSSSTSNSKALTSPLPSRSQMSLLDSSGTLILEAKIRIATPEPGIIGRAEKELLDFKKRISGVVELEAPERLALDTRCLTSRPRLLVKGQVQGQGGGAKAQPQAPARA